MKVVNSLLFHKEIKKLRIEKKKKKKKPIKKHKNKKKNKKNEKKKKKKKKTPMQKNLGIRKNDVYNHTMQTIKSR